MCAWVRKRPSAQMHEVPMCVDTLRQLAETPALRWLTRSLPSWAASDRNDDEGDDDDLDDHCDDNSDDNCDNDGDATAEGI